MLLPRSTPSSRPLLRSSSGHKHCDHTAGGRWEALAGLLVMRRCAHRPVGLLRGWPQERPRAHGNLRDRQRECRQVNRPCQWNDYD